MARLLSTLALVAAFVLAGSASAAPPAGQTSYPASKVWDATKDAALQTILDEGRVVPSMTVAQMTAITCNTARRGARVWVTDSLLTAGSLVGGGSNALTTVCNGSAWTFEMSQSPATDLVCGSACVGADEITDGAVQTAEIQDAAVTSAKIQNGTITDTDVGSVGAAKLTSGTNTQAAIVLGSGASLTTTGTGKILPFSGLVADLGTCDGTNIGQRKIVTDSTANNSCSSGGGATTVECVCGGSSWSYATRFGGPAYDVICGASGCISATEIADGSITTTDISGTAGITDAQVSDTLTASKLAGSGSTTDAVDLATAEVAGLLPEANIDAAIMRDSESVPRLEGAADPTTSTDCVTIGTVYTNTTTGALFVCLDDSPNVWARSTPSIVASLNLEAPSTFDDATRSGGVPSTVTVTEIFCSTDTGTVTLNLERRTRTTPGTAGTALLSSAVVCDTDGQIGSPLIATPTAGTSDVLTWRISAVNGANRVTAFATAN